MSPPCSREAKTFLTLATTVADDPTPCHRAPSQNHLRSLMCPFPQSAGIFMRAVGNFGAAGWESTPECPQTLVCPSNFPAGSFFPPIGASVSVGKKNHGRIDPRSMIHFACRPFAAAAWKLNCAPFECTCCSGQLSSTLLQRATGRRCKTIVDSRIGRTNATRIFRGKQ